MAPRDGTWNRFEPVDLQYSAGDCAWTSDIIVTNPFNRAVASVNVKNPIRERVILQLRVECDGNWTAWHTMMIGKDGKWASQMNKGDAFGRVKVDTLELYDPKTAAAFQVRLLTDIATDSGGANVSDLIRSIGVTHYLKENVHKKEVVYVRCGNALADRWMTLWGCELAVAPRSQTSEDPKIASRICSPTSLAMVLEFFGKKFETAALAKEVYDSTSDLYGNWSVNVAVAGRHIGEAFAVHCDSLDTIETEIAAGRPVILSHSWKEGELTHAPILKSSGHLIVVIGFTKDGDVVVLDPAAPPAEVRRVYRRNELFHTWQNNASGIVYLFRPAT
ncbi:MAG: C39 family peptidase [Planctomycetota bacterium]